MNNKYKKEIAIFTDAHALIEPLEAILLDIKKRGIKEIYSLGDNIGTGVNPNEVMNMLNKNGVISVAGNAEYYITIGIAPFRNYFDKAKIDSRDWTYNQLSKKNINVIKKMPPSIDLTIGNKRIALCHFVNDVRIDYTLRSTWTYQDDIKYEEKAYEQFSYTNSPEQKKDILKNIDNPKPFYDGFRDSYKNPLFNGKSPFEYDYIFQGHVHYKSIVKSPTTIFYTVGMVYREDNIATYIILKEKDDGFDIEEVFVNFDRDKMLKRVEKSDLPSKGLINKYLRY